MKRTGQERQTIRNDDSCVAFEQFYVANIRKNVDKQESGGVFA
jgi:hypothetical protein